MGATGWASAEQKALLQRFAPDYMACRVAKKYKEFWRSLFAAYLSQFPLVEEMYPGRKLDSLSEAETSEYTQSLSKLQARLKEWYRWQYNPRSRSATAAITAKVLKQIYAPRKRGPKQYEVFARLFPEKVAAAQRDWCERTGSKGNQIIGKWHSICKELLENATDEEKQAVEEALATTSQDEWDDRDPEEYPPEILQRYLTMLPTLLSAVVEPATRKAGALAFVTIVAPVPEKGGQIDVQTIQLGDKTDTPLLAKVWNEHEDKFVNAVTSFAIRHEFPPEVCARRSMFTKKEERSDSGSEPELPEPAGDDAAVGLSAGSSVTPPPCPAGSVELVASIPEQSSTLPLSLVPPTTDSSSTAAFREFGGEVDSPQPVATGLTNLDSLQSGFSNAQSSVGSLLGPALPAGSFGLEMSSAPPSSLVPSVYPISPQSSASHLHPASGFLSQTLPPLTPQGPSRYTPSTPQIGADSLEDQWSDNSTGTRYPLRLPTPQVSWKDREYWVDKGVLGNPLDPVSYPNSSAYEYPVLYTMPKMAEDGNSYDDEGENGQRYDRHRHRQQQSEGQQYKGQRFEDEWYSEGRRDTERQDPLTGVSSDGAAPQPSFLDPPSNLLLSSNLRHPLVPAGDRWDDSQRNGYGDIAVDTPVPHLDGANGMGTPPSPSSITHSALPPPPASDSSSPTAHTPGSNSLTPTIADTFLAESTPRCDSQLSEIAESTTSSKPLSQPSRPWTPQTQPWSLSTCIGGAARQEPAQALVWTRTEPSPPESHPRPVTPKAVSSHSDPTSTSPSPLGRESPTPPGPIVVRGTPQESSQKAPTPPPTPPHLCFGGEGAPSSPTSTGLSLPIVEEPMQEEPPQTEPVPCAHRPPPPAVVQRRSARAVVLAKRDDGVQQNAIDVVVPINAVMDRTHIPVAPNLPPAPAAVGQRRSTRAVVLSKRDDHVDRGCTQALPPSQPVAEPTSLQRWYHDVEGLVKIGSLGIGWMTLVNRWIDLEKALRYGEGSRVTLSSKLRPVEWSTWVRGGRKSQERPIIGDPQEFGEAVTRWWGMLKGDVGQEGALSTRLTKSGPNGISSLVLLLFWWGQAAIAGPGEWLGDSMPAWRSTVQEVTDTFASLLVAMTGPSGLSPAVERMTEGATTRASKRGRLADESVDTANKRNRR